MPTPEQTIILQTQLAEAKAAYHRLMLGGAARVIVDQNGERVEFLSANAGKLAQYILSLEQQLGLACPSGPMRVWF